jgi:hypothetical protein
MVVARRARFKTQKHSEKRNRIPAVQVADRSAGAPHWGRPPTGCSDSLRVGDAREKGIYDLTGGIAGRSPGTPRSLQLADPRPSGDGRFCRRRSIRAGGKAVRISAGMGRALPSPRYWVRSVSSGPTEKAVVESQFHIIPAHRWNVHLTSQDRIERRFLGANESPEYCGRAGPISDHDWAYDGFAAGDRNLVCALPRAFLSARRNG